MSLNIWRLGELSSIAKFPKFLKTNKQKIISEWIYLISDREV